MNARVDTAGGDGNRDATTAFSPALYLLLIDSLLALGYVSREWTMVAPFMLAVALHPRLGRVLRFRVGYLGYLVLAIPFAALYNLHDIATSTVFDLSFAFYVAMYVHLHAVLGMYRPRPGGNLVAMVILASGLGLVVSGPGTDDFVAYSVILFVYGLGLVVALRSGLRVRSAAPAMRRRSRLALACACLLTVLATVAGILLARAYFYDVNRLLLRLALRVPLASAVGFSDVSRLGDVQRLRDDPGRERVTIRAFSAGAPGYLRGNVFAQYGGGRWTRGGCRPAEVNLRAAAAGRGRAVPKSRRVLRCLVPGRPAPDDFLQPRTWIYPAGSLCAHFFLPLAASAFDSAGTVVLRLLGNAFRSKYKSTARGYGVISGPGPVFDADTRDRSRLPGATRQGVDPLYLQLPLSPVFRRELDRVLADACRDCPWILHAGGGYRDGRRVEAAVAALARYFSVHYTYQIGISFRTNSPVREFLHEKRHGHCELFASAGVMLLRRLGIPARYVTGFVCAEKSPLGEVWIARAKHAHAWVEYLHPEHGWSLAEFTPASARPRITPPASRLQATLEYLRALWERAAGYFLREGFNGVLAVFGRLGFWFIADWPRRAATAVAFLAFFLWRLRSRRRGRRRQRGVRELPPELARRRARYLRLERRLARMGFPRREQETLLEYARRLAAADLAPVTGEDGRSLAPGQVADAVRAFALARYR